MSTSDTDAENSNDDGSRDELHGEGCERASQKEDMRGILQDKVSRVHIISGGRFPAHFSIKTDDNEHESIIGSQNQGMKSTYDCFRPNPFLVRKNHICQLNKGS